MITNDCIDENKIQKKSDTLINETKNDIIMTWKTQHPKLFGLQQLLSHKTFFPSLINKRCLEKQSIATFDFIIYCATTKVVFIKHLKSVQRSIERFSVALTFPRTATPRMHAQNNAGDATSSCGKNFGML